MGHRKGHCEYKRSSQVPGTVKQLNKLKIPKDEMGSEIKGVKVFAENTDRENAIELPGEIVQQVLSSLDFQPRFFLIT